MDPPRWIETDNDIGFNESDFNKCENNFVVNYRYLYTFLRILILQFQYGAVVDISRHAFLWPISLSRWLSSVSFHTLVFWLLFHFLVRARHLQSGGKLAVGGELGRRLQCRNIGRLRHPLTARGWHFSMGRLFRLERFRLDSNWNSNSGAIVTANILIAFVALGWYTASPIESASICLLLGGSFCGALILTRHWSRQGLIIATSISGSVLIVGGVDYFIEEWRLMGTVYVI